MKGNKICSKTVNKCRSSKHFIGYNKVINKQLNEKLLNNYFNICKLKYFPCVLQPCLSSLYCLTKHAEEHDVKVMIPPTLIIGFNDNRFAYTSRATKSLTVKYAKPNYDKPNKLDPEKYQEITPVLLEKIIKQNFEQNDDVLLLYNYTPSSGSGV